MGNRTTRKSKLNKNVEESRVELAKHAKKLSDKELKGYFSKAIPIFLIQITVLLSMLAVSKNAGIGVGNALVCANGLITITYFFVLDAIPARQMKKNSKDLQRQYTPNQVKVFYAALKTRTIIRTPINALLTLITLVITLVVFVL